MANINLLPWREERRDELKKEFFTILGGMVVVALAIILGWHAVMNNAIDDQRARNAYLESKIKELDAQVKEIDELKQRRAELIDRMKIIQDLQGNRPEIVHIFDELVRTVPDGVFYRVVDRKAGSISIEGTAESNNRVSSLMRKFDASEWFKEPNLLGVVANPNFGEQANDFELKVLLDSPVQQDEEDGLAKGK